RPRHHRLASELEQELVLTHAGRLAGGEDDAGDLHPSPSSEVAPGRRGDGRDASSSSSPPTPIAASPAKSTSTSAHNRSSTQSKPDRFSERAQPGRPIIVAAPSRPSSSRLPGSTGMPSRMIV